jgi:hypothetical protein
MSGKRGRPKKAIVQEKMVGFYVTFDQWAIIRRKAEKARVNISDYMRQVAIDSQVRAKWTAEEREMVRKLIGMSVELHGLVTIAREQGSTVALELFRGYRDIMDDIIKKLCHDRYSCSYGEDVWRDVRVP